MKFRPVVLALAAAALAAVFPARALDEGELMDRAVAAARKAANAPRPKGAVLESRLPGRTYVTEIEAQLAGRAQNGDWGFAKHGNALLRATLAYQSRILANDGLTVVEDREYKLNQAALVVSVDRITLDFVNPQAAYNGLLGLLALESPAAAALARQGFAWLFDELGVTITDEHVAFNEKVVLSRRDGELFAAMRLDSLAGKTVRITYRNDGTGIQSIAPQGGARLSPEEEAVIRQGCYLFDAAFLDNGRRAVGDRWAVPAAVFGNLVGAAFTGDATGELQFERMADAQLPDAAGQPRLQTVLALDRAGTGEIRIHQQAKHGDRFTYDETATLRNLSGTAQFVRTPSPDGGKTPPEMYLYKLEARGSAEVKLKSRDHLLFQARFEAAPQVSMRYLCFARPEAP